MSEKWQVKSASYHDKKRNKLWITVLIHDINSYNPKTEVCNNYLTWVLFEKGKEPKINNLSVYNCTGKPKEYLLTQEQQEMILNAAQEEATKYLPFK